MTTGDDIRDAQRATWDELAPGWATWDAIIQAELGPVGDALIERLAIRDDGRHLDVASGTGEPGLTIARRAPGGCVVLTDLSAQMLAIAEERARAAGVGNVEVRVSTADDLPFDDASFDTASVRFGHMFFPDPAAANREIARVLVPGGRLGAAVWAEAEANPWISIVMDAVADEMPPAPPDPDAPGIFRFPAPGMASALLADAGLTDVVEWDVPVALVTADPDQYWEVMGEDVSPAVVALRGLNAPARQRVRDVAIAGVAAFEEDGVVRVPGLARCVVGTKPR